MLDEQEYPVGCVVFPTAVAYMTVWNGIFHNRDMLAGPASPNDPPWVWGVRITEQGSNGYKHEKDWLMFLLSRGKACATVGPIPDNKMVTFVRVESMEIAMQKGPDAYGYSR
jgi:hypothetical protein